MIQVEEMPVEGQFVAVWEFNSKVWSSTFERINDKLFEFTCDESDNRGWEPTNFPCHGQENIKYFTYK